MNLEAQLERENPPVPPKSLYCHSTVCIRAYNTIEELIGSGTKDPDPFYWSEELDSWICPDCGGTDVY